MTQEQIDLYLANATKEDLAERVYSRQLDIPKDTDGGPRYPDELERHELVMLLRADFRKLNEQEV